MKIGPAGISLIKRFEGLRLTAYVCPALKPTIGYGHTNSVTADDVTAGRTITEEEAERLLRQDLAFFEAGVSKYVRVPVTQNQFDAMVSLAYNIGLGAFKGSSVLKRVNAGKTKDAALAFMMWTKAGGKVLPGLLRRRDAEMRLFLEK